jgi:hypothetical protein
MLLTISTTHHPTSDLGFMLHKHPDKLQSIDLSIGKVHIFYPEYSIERISVALMLDIDPIDLIRGSRNLSGKEFTLGQYVNDRPYVASSFMNVAIAKAFSTAMNEKCATKPELVEIKMPFEVKISVLPAPKGGELLNDYQGLRKEARYYKSIPAVRKISATEIQENYFRIKLDIGLIIDNRLP